MGSLNLVAVTAGLVLVIAGWGRARGPWVRYQALRDQDRNVARYEAWRGGVRDRSTTGASVAMAILRRQILIGAGIALAGLALVIAAFAVR